MYQLSWSNYETHRDGSVIGDLNSIFMVFFYLKDHTWHKFELYQLGPCTTILERDGRSVPWWK